MLEVPTFRVKHEWLSSHTHKPPEEHFSPRTFFSCYIHTSCEATSDKPTAIHGNIAVPWRVSCGVDLPAVVTGSLRCGGPDLTQNKELN